jgi:hypothetical protein
MKWMLHDRKRNELSFRLEEHEIVDGMEYVLEINGPKMDGDKKVDASFGCGAKKVNSEWILKYQIPDAVQLHLGVYTFIVFNSNTVIKKGDYVIATGFVHGNRFVCHQAMTKQI